MAASTTLLGPERKHAAICPIDMLGSDMSNRDMLSAELGRHRSAHCTPRGPGSDSEMCESEMRLKAPRSHAQMDYVQ